MIPSITSVTLTRRGIRFAPSSRAVSAMIPPSPWLSARMMKVTYLTETIIVIDQNTSEITPYTLPAVTCTDLLSMLKTA